MGHAIAASVANSSLPRTAVPQTAFLDGVDSLIDLLKLIHHDLGQGFNVAQDKP